jgi:hypothetical protein
MTFMAWRPRDKFYLLLGIFAIGIILIGIVGNSAFFALNNSPAATSPSVSSVPGISPEASTDASTCVGNTTKITTIFVQEATGGSFVRDSTGNYSLTMTDAIPYTLFFSDRPAQDAGFVPTDLFIKGFNWDPRNPPNALIMVKNAKEEEDSLVVKLTSPRYNETGHSLTYNAQVVPYASFKSEWADDLSQMADARIPATFGHVTLVIDDCPCKVDDAASSPNIRCRTGCHESCWNWKKFACYTDCGRCCSECNPPVCEIC